MTTCINSMSYKAKIKDLNAEQEPDGKPTASKSLPPAVSVHTRCFKDASSNTVELKKAKGEGERRDQALGSPSPPPEPSPPTSCVAMTNLNNRDEIGLQCSLSLGREANSLIVAYQDGSVQSASFE